MSDLNNNAVATDLLPKLKDMAASKQEKQLVI